MEQVQIDELLRPEARPLPYETLDGQQRTGFDRGVTLLYAALQASDRASHVTGQATGGPGHVYLDHRRSSRTILVSGHRGTGKTTLMLSLAEHLAPRTGRTQAPPNTEGRLRTRSTSPVSLKRYASGWSGLRL